MAKLNTTAQRQKQIKKITPSKKQVKQQKINTKKGKKAKPSESQLDEDEEDFNEQQLSQNQNDEKLPENDNSQQSQDEDPDSDQDDSHEQSSSQSLAPENYAIKQMSFRERRGTKMNYLMNKKKDEEEDPFWQNQGQNYFGNLEDQEQEDEDYQQSSSGRDQFDSDFGQTESEHSDQQKKAQQPQIDEDKLKEKKKQQQLMRKIQAPAPKKVVPKANSQAKKHQSEKKSLHEVGNRYIHQVCTQEQLLGEAAQTEYINWLSLQKLISLENDKKDFTHKQHFLEGEKIIFRDRINQQGIRCTSYELVGVQVNKISDLNQIWHQKDIE